MIPRLENPHKLAPSGIKAMMALEASIAASGLEPALVELVRMRASQINGCAFCVDMHAADARKGGETERRLHAVSVWHETPFFTPRERAALAWTEAVTQISTRGVQVVGRDAQFTQKEQMDLTLAISMINCWNRLAISFRKMPDA